MNLRANSFGVTASSLRLPFVIDEREKKTLRKSANLRGILGFFIRPRFMSPPLEVLHKANQIALGSKSFEPAFAFLSLPFSSSREKYGFPWRGAFCAGRKWVERLSPSQAYLGAAIAQRHNFPEIIGRLLAARDVSLDQAPDVFNPTLRALCPIPRPLPIWTRRLSAWVMPFCR